MKIVFQYDGILPVKKYGGTERMIYWHMKQLVRMGHEVVLIAHEKSNVSKDGITLIKNSIKNPNWTTLIPQDTDILHLQYNFDPKIGIPTLNTIHGNGKLGENFNLNTVFVSKSHAENHGSNSYINNALDLDEYPFEPLKKKNRDWNRFLFLGKASWKVKNLKSCVKATLKAKKELYVAGGRSYYPSLRIKNFGFVDQNKKLELINSCSALLFPVLWPEPFGLAVIEANALGIPSITTPYGALRDIVTKENGIHVNNIEELINVLRENLTGNFEPQQIRNYVETNFSIVNYSEKYLDLYKKVIQGIPLNEKSPTFQFESSAENLLPF